jgi:hypothetical protein
MIPSHAIYTHTHTMIGSKHMSYQDKIKIKKRKSNRSFWWTKCRLRKDLPNMKVINPLRMKWQKKILIIKYGCGYFHIEKINQVSNCFMTLNKEVECHPSLFLWYLTAFWHWTKEINKMNIIFFSSIGANIYTHHHHPNQVSSTIKVNQTTSDYYSNSSKHEEG